MLAARDAGRAAIAARLAAIIASGSCPGDAAARLAGAEAALEAAVYEAARAQPKTEYALHLGRLLEVLDRPVSVLPDEIACNEFARARISAADLLSSAVLARAQPAPRVTCARLFARALIAASDEFARDPERVRALATAIEVACFNAAVRTSKESAEPSRRAWDSPVFVDIYSTRCGAIYSALDPASASCRTYGPQLTARLLSGELTPGALGEMSERDMCPPALAAERAEIASRSAQRIIEKESALFRCPHCNARRCSYIEVQRRSLDEAPDYICKCLACNHKFTGRQ
jgi:DNA-directed RNA polymerase subunit M/transcription elongation factor TFIIS